MDDGGENEAKYPWEPYHVERGMTESTVAPVVERLG